MKSTALDFATLPEPFFREIFVRCPSPLALVDEETGQVEEANRALSELFGYSVSEFRGRSLPDLSVWPDLAARQRLFQRVSAEGRVVEHEVRLRRRDGSLADVLLTVEPLQLGDRRYALKSFRDISQRRAAERQAERNQKLFTDLFEFAPDGTLMVARDGRILRLNQRAEQLFGYSRAELVGRSVDDLLPEALRAVHEQHRARFALAPSARQMGDRDSALLARRKDGTTFPAQISIGAVETDDGLVMVAAIRDMTQQQTAMDARQKAEQSLRQAQKMEALGTLAGGIAHDFNNILAGLFGYLELARMELAAGHPAVVWLDNTVGACNRAKALVEQILTFSRRAEGEPKRVDLAEVVDETVKFLRSTLPVRVALRIDVEPGCPAVLGDPVQLEQVLMNLCTNAWHALPDKGGEIRLSLSTAQLTPLERAQHPDFPAGPAASLTVADNGCGMPRAVLERIFEPFFTTKPVGRGTGLGLAMVDGIVRSHGGFVQVESTPGAGTTFRILLPGTAAAAAAGKGLRGLAVPTRGLGEHVLVLDDERDVRESVALLLERLGYRVSQFGSAREAVEAFRAAPLNYAAVLTDYSMPDLDGLEVARAMIEARPDVPIILFSGFVDAAVQERVRTLKVRKVLHKPPTLAELAATVQECVRPRPAPAAEGTSSAQIFALTDEEKLIREQVMLSPGAVTITRANLDEPGPTIIAVSPGFEALTGYTAAEVEGRSPRFLQGPITDRTVLRRLRHCCEHGETFQGEAVNYRKDGSPFLMRWFVRPIRDHAGKTTHFVATQEDLTQADPYAPRWLEAEARARDALDQANQLHTALVQTVSAIEKTKQQFKSVELGALRRRLQHLLAKPAKKSPPGGPGRTTG
jgi:PAS domain S-box-containing protein